VPAVRSLNEAVKLGEKPMLLFAATLKYKGDSSLRASWILDGVGYYVIGFFFIKEVRFVSNNGTMNWPGHQHNAHYRRPDHDKGVIKILIEGGRGSRLLKKPLPISVRPKSRLEPLPWLRRNFRELRGGPIGEGPWYRRTLRNAPATNSGSVLKELAQHEE
jgi:hypothetical protein